MIKLVYNTGLMKFFENSYPSKVPQKGAPRGIGVPSIQSQRPSVSISDPPIQTLILAFPESEDRKSNGKHE